MYSAILNGRLNTINATASASSILAGASITAISANTAYAARFAFTSSLPTLSTGLGSGFLWRCSTTNALYIIP